MSLFKYIRHRYTKYRRAAFFGSSVPSSSGEALCVCSWESGGFQLFKCGYPYLCKTIQLQKAASCQDFFPLYYTFFFLSCFVVFLFFFQTFASFFIFFFSYSTVRTRLFAYFFCIGCSEVKPTVRKNREGTERIPSIHTGSIYIYCRLYLYI